MLRISDESHWRVREAIQNMEYACYLEDDYEQWEDIAASAFSDSSYLSRSFCLYHFLCSGHASET